MNSEIQFEIDGRYKNRNGWYEVIEINGDRLHIRYEKDGIEANLGMEMQKRIMANMTLEEKQESPPLVQNKINISNESFKELYKRVCATLKDSGFDMEDVVYPFPDFKKIDDKRIFEGLCKAIFTAQAKWKSYEKNLDRIDLLLFNYDFNKIKNITDEEIEKIYEEMIKMKVRDRFLLRKLNDFRKNARVFF